MKKYVLIDVGGTDTKYSLAAQDGTLLDAFKVKTASHSAEAQVELIADIVNEYKKLEEIEGLSLSLPGFIDPFNGFVIRVNSIKGFVNYPLKEKLEEKIKVNVEMENDVNCVALAEKWRGSAVDSNNFICITLGTGIGGGIFINGELYRGQGFMAGEFGFMLTNGVKNNIPFNCRWESQGSVAAIRRRFAMRRDENFNDISGRELFKAADNGDTFAQDEVNYFYELLSYGIFNLTFVFNPEKILIGGAISQREDLIDKVYSKLELLLSNEMLSLYKRDVRNIIKIERTKFLNDSGKLGALYHYLKMRGEI